MKNGSAENRENKFNPYGFRVRLILSIIAVVSLTINSVMAFAIVEDSPLCIKDLPIRLTENLNHYFKKSHKIRNFSMIISSFCLDLLVIITSLAWIKYGRNWRPCLALFLFFSLKIFCNYLFSVKVREDSLWGYPGFPSLIVSYETNNDFFFSGYIGLNVICCFELYKLEFKFASILGTLYLIFQILIYIILRANYFIDIIASLFAAHYFCYISDFYSHKLNYIINLDYIGEKYDKTKYSQSREFDVISTEGNQKK